MRVSVIIALMLWSYSVKAQNSNSNWCFGDSAGINFTDTTQPLSFQTAMDGRGSCASISDSVGNLLFYAFTRAGSHGPSGTLYNRYNHLLQNGDSIIGDGWYNEMMILPRPKNSNQYFLVCSSVTAGLWPLGLFYSVIDMSANSDSGAVVEKNDTLRMYKGFDGLAAVRHANGRDWWLLTKDNDSTDNNFQIYFIDSSGIHLDTIQSIGGVSSTGLGNLTFNPTGNKLLVTAYTGATELLDFDRCTGLLSHPNIILAENLNIIRKFVGSCFSPSGNLIYISAQDTFSYIYQFDLNTANIFNSRFIIDTLKSLPLYSAGFMRLAPDKKVYLSQAWFNGQNNNYPYQDSVFNIYNMNLSVVDNPDVYGAGCNFHPYGFNLGGKRTYWGLPNNPDYQLGRLTSSLCDSLMISISEFSTSGFNIYPNPGSSEVKISTSGKEKCNVELINMQGEVLITYSCRSTCSLDISTIPEGVYLLRITTSHFVQSEKFIKVN